MPGERKSYSDDQARRRRRNHGRRCAGLPPNTDFNLFVIQVPKNPFGVAWYQGDLKTGKKGRAHQQFAGRFSVETFAVAEGSVSAPVVFTNGVLPDAAINPPFNPI